MEGLCHDKHDELWRALWLTGPARPLCERWKILGWNGQGDRAWRWIILSHIFPYLVHLEWRGVVKLWVLEFCFLLRISIWKRLRKSCRLRTFTSYNLADFCWQGSLCKPLIYELGGWSKCCRSTHSATIKLFAEFWVAKTGQEHPGKSVQTPVTFEHQLTACLGPWCQAPRTERKAEAPKYRRSFVHSKTCASIMFSDYDQHEFLCTIVVRWHGVLNRLSWSNQSPDLSRFDCECVTPFQRLRQILYAIHLFNMFPSRRAEYTWNAVIRFWFSAKQIRLRCVSRIRGVSGLFNALTKRTNAALLHWYSAIIFAQIQTPWHIVVPSMSQRHHRHPHHHFIYSLTQRTWWSCLRLMAINILQKLRSSQNMKCFRARQVRVDQCHISFYQCLSINHFSVFFFWTKMCSFCSSTLTTHHVNMWGFYQGAPVTSSFALSWSRINQLDIRERQTYLYFVMK